MKKISIIIAVITALSAMLAGCSGGAPEQTSAGLPIDGPSRMAPQQTSQAEENTVPPDITEALEQDTQAQLVTGPEEQPQPTVAQPQPGYQSTLIDRIPLMADIGLGFETRDLTVNGQPLRVTVEYLMDASVIPTDPCYTYYTVSVNTETVDVGRAFLSDSTAQFIRETPEEELYGINFEIFEYDFNAAAYAGADMEYVVVSVPAGWDADSASMIIATAEGRLLANMTVDKSFDVALSGPDTEKYKDHEGRINFFAFNEQSITYLAPVGAADGVTYFSEHALTVSGDTVTDTDTGVIYQTSSAVPQLGGINIY